jgi:hypothetical protein
MLKTERNTLRNVTEKELDRFLRYPTRKVIGVLDTPHNLDAVLSALVAAGFGPESIQVLSGEEGIRAIDPAGGYHGLLSRLTRIIQAIGQEHEHMHRYEEELRPGHYLVVISVPDDEARRQRAAAILSEHGGHFVNYYGPLAIVHLVP